jgi:hypothetical protein
MRVKLTTSLDLARAWAAELGLNGPLGGAALVRDEWLDGAPPEETAMAAALLAEATTDVHRANAESYLSRLCTMLHWLALFTRGLPHWVLFMPIDGADRLANATHNENTCLMFATFMRANGSIAAGRVGDPIKVDTALAVVSTLRAYRSLEARYSLHAVGTGLALKAWTKAQHHTDGPSSSRVLALGIRSADFRLLRDLTATGVGHGGATWDTTSRDGIMANCVAVLSNNIVARGGEVGLASGKKMTDFDPQRGFVISDITWHSPSVASKGLSYAIVRWYPIKDKDFTHKKVPMLVSRRSAGAVGADPQCPYDALLLAYQIRTREVAASEHASTAFFTTAAGKIYNTDTVRKIARVVAKLLGHAELDFSGKSFRIGGASDVKEAFGDEGGKRVLHERGRWCSDIAHIYSRMSITSQLAVSRGMTYAHGHDLERSSGWTQPAWR